jgi:hypothetical protein
LSILTNLDATFNGTLADLVNDAAAEKFQAFFASGE